MTTTADGEIDVPKVGPVDKKVVAAVVVGAVGFIGYRRWQASKVPAETATTDTATLNSEFDNTGDPSAVLGAVRPNNDYGIPDTSAAPITSPDDFGFRGTTNDQWTQYVATQLSQSDRWSYTDIVEALGNYLAQKPTTAAQQGIVNAAIAVAGMPPSGSHTLVSGGNVPLTVAPTVTGITTTASTAVVTFTPVAGATTYVAYRNGVASNVAASKGSPITVAGLQPNTDYTFTVRGVTAAGVTGPSSGSIKGKTKAVTMAVPKSPVVSKIGATTATFTTTAVSGATGYNWILSGHPLGHSDVPTWNATGLHSKTKYTVAVQADNATQPATAASVAKSFTTK